MSTRTTFSDIAPPIHLSSTYEVTWEEAQRLSEGDESVAFYSRNGNPTVREVEAQLTQLIAPPERIREYSSLLTSSGMAATSTCLLALLQSGDEVLATDTLYGGTSRFFDDVLPRFGVTVRRVAPDLANAAEAISPRTKVLWVESPANPLNRLVPLQSAVELARRHGLVSCIDSTFAPPPLQNALHHGFDIEMHAATKYLGGHSDLLAGALIGRREIIERVRRTHLLTGAVLDAHAAYLLGRGLQTLDLRVRALCDNALQLARWLEEQPQVARVHYPLLRSSREYSRAQQQMPRGAGAIVAFDVKGESEEAARRVVENLRLIRHAPSLGGTETLISYPPLASHAGHDEAQLRAAGITRGTLRLAVGLEAQEELRRDLGVALAA